VPTPFPLEPLFRGLRGSEPFLQDIAESPHDDTIRLIFADWLADHGAEDRADLIRLQVRLAALPAWDRPVRDVQRARQLESKVRWVDAPPGVQMSRGLYTHAILKRPLFDQWANQRNVNVNRVASLLQLVREIQSAIDLQELTIAFHPGSGWLKELAASGHLDTIKTFRLAWGVVDQQAIKGLAEGKLAHVNELDLWGGRIEETGVRSLMVAPWCGQLLSLNLGDNRLRDAGVTALGQSLLASRLETLHLMMNEITSQGVAEFARAPFIELKNLNLFANQIDDRGANALVASPHLGKLVELDLRGNALTTSGQSAIKARWPFAKTA
jgi:uncharacterized protein (TIGR02996 family)